jgi:hypothetical protein
LIEGKKSGDAGKNPFVGTNYEVSRKNSTGEGWRKPAVGNGGGMVC